VIIFENIGNAIFQKYYSFYETFDIKLAKNLFSTFLDILYKGPIDIFLKFFENMIERIAEKMKDVYSSL
jgi:hypothetical protein